MFGGKRLVLWILQYLVSSGTLHSPPWEAGVDLGGDGNGIVFPPVWSPLGNVMTKCLCQETHSMTSKVCITTHAFSKPLCVNNLFSPCYAPFLTQINLGKSYWYTNTTIHTIEHGERGKGLCTMHVLVTAFWCWLGFQIGLLSEMWETQTEKIKSWVVQTSEHAVETFLFRKWRWIVWGWGTISQSISVLWNLLHSFCSWKFQKHIIGSCLSMMVDVVGIQCDFCGTKWSEFYKGPQDRGVGTLGIHCYFCGTKQLELSTGTAW